jgi:hypothetical protein
MVMLRTKSVQGLSLLIKEFLRIFSSNRSKQYMIRLTIKGPTLFDKTTIERSEARRDILTARPHAPEDTKLKMVKVMVPVLL